MIAEDETEPRDETIENVRGCQTFIFRKSTNTSLYNTGSGSGNTRTYLCMRVFARVHTCSSSNLDPNIRLTFCDGDCISLLFHTLPFLRETASLSTSRKTYFLGYPDEGEIKGIAEIKGGQWREIAEVWCPTCARGSIELTSSLPGPRSPFAPTPSSTLPRLQSITKKLQCETGMYDFISAPKNDYICRINIFIVGMPPGKRGGLL